MKHLCFIISVLAIGSGIVMLLDAKYGPQATTALFIILIGTVFFVGAGIMDAIDKLRIIVENQDYD